MTQPLNIVRTGATGQGKTLACVGDVVRSRDAEVVLDPEKDSLAAGLLPHVTGDFLFDRLDQTRHVLGIEMLTPSSHPNPAQRAFENDRSAKAFAAILLRRRDADTLAATPLLEEWVMAALNFLLAQGSRKRLTMLPYAFLPGTPQFKALLRDCADPIVAHKFRQLEGLNPRALRSEVSSAARLVNGVMSDPAFAARCAGGFDLGAALDRRCKIIIEGGDAGDDAKRAILGAFVLKVIEYAKRRPRPFPVIRLRIDEATAAGLVGKPELRGIAQTRKYGLFFDFLGQTLDYPGGAGQVLQNCKRHEWYGCPDFDLARKAAIDILAALRPDGRSRAERLEELTHDVMTLRPGERWVREGAAAWREYVPLLKNPWPDWPGLHDAKIRDKLARVYNRPEYRMCEVTPSATTSPPETPPPGSSPEPASPARRLKRDARRRTGGSADSGSESESA